MSETTIHRGIEPVGIDPRELINALFTDCDTMVKMNATTLVHILTALDMLLEEKNERFKTIVIKYGPNGLHRITSAENEFSTALFVLKREINECLMTFCKEIVSCKSEGRSLEDIVDKTTHVILEFYDKVEGLEDPPK